MMATGSVHALLRDLKTRVGGVAAALVARNGIVLFADLPDGVFAETFAVMCATIVGAATTANRELHRAGPERVVIEGRDATTVIVGSGESALLIVVVDGWSDLEAVISETAKFAHFVEAVPHGASP